MTTITIQTTLGPASIPLSKHAVEVESCGIDFFDNLQVRVWTSDDHSSGYVVYFNLMTQKRRLKRIEVSYIDASSQLKYGRRNVAHETLPIIKS
jgi:hypothetical protein